jgi:hypothetical protein
MVVVPRGVDNQKQQCTLYLANGVPTLFTIFNTVKSGDAIRIEKDHLCGIKTNAMLGLVDLVLVFIPFKYHGFPELYIYRIVNTSGDRNNPFLMRPSALGFWASV